MEDLADDAVHVLDGYGMWHLLSGSARDCDEAAIRAMARENFDRSNNTLMSFDHGALSGGDAWLGPFGELAARSSGTGSTRISLGLE